MTIFCQISPSVREILTAACLHRLRCLGLWDLEEQRNAQVLQENFKIHKRFCMLFVTLYCYTLVLVLDGDGYIKHTFIVHICHVIIQSFVKTVGSLLRHYRLSGAGQGFRTSAVHVVYILFLFKTRLATYSKSFMASTAQITVHIYANVTLL